MREVHPDIGGSIKESGDLSKEVEEKLKAAISEFKEDVFIVNEDGSLEEASL